MGLKDRLQHAWNAFTRDPTSEMKYNGSIFSYRPDRPKISCSTEKTIVTAIYNRIALDVAAINFKHCKLDNNNRYLEDMNTGLNKCLTLEANMDQSSREFIRDLVLSMFDEGCVCLVPTATNVDNPRITEAFDIGAMRTAKIIDWRPKDVKIRVYNEDTGRKEEIVVPKKMVCIIENPFYPIMNEANSAIKRLIRKMNLLDFIDEQTGSGKLDLIIQLPYVIKSDARRQQANARRKEIEEQLTGSKYGIAYTDGTEKVTQLNRSLENNLLKQIESLQATVYSQLGLTQEIMNGTADEQVMLNYYNRTIQPIVDAIVDEIKRKWLTKTARTQKQTIQAFNDPFKLVPVNNIAEIADKFTRNEIMTSNEIRQVIGLKPSTDPKADQLVNSNVSQSDEMLDRIYGETKSDETKIKEGENQNG